MRGGIRRRIRSRGGGVERRRGEEGKRGGLLDPTGHLWRFY